MCEKPEQNENKGSMKMDGSVSALSPHAKKVLDLSLVGQFRPRMCWRDYICHLAQEHFRIPPQGRAGERGQGEGHLGYFVGEWMDG